VIPTRRLGSATRRILRLREASALLTTPFRDTQTSPTAVPDDGFNWGDWAIGIGSGIGLTALLAGGLLITRQLRHRLQTA
jgi:hypothetical protein